MPHLCLHLSVDPPARFRGCLWWALLLPRAVLRGQGFLTEAVGLRSGDALRRGKDPSCPQLLSSDHPELSGSDTQLLREFASDLQLLLARASRWSVCPSGCSPAPSLLFPRPRFSASGDFGGAISQVLQNGVSWEVLLHSCPVFPLLPPFT